MRTIMFGLLLLSTDAPAEVTRYRTTLDVQVGDPDMTAATLTDILLKTDRKLLDACWRKPGTMEVAVAFNKGAVASAEPSGDGGAPDTKACIAKVLRAIKLANTTTHMFAMFELVGFTGAPPPLTPPSRPPPPPPRLPDGEEPNRRILDNVIDSPRASALRNSTGRDESIDRSGGERGTGSAPGAGSGGSIESSPASPEPTGPRAIQVDLRQPPTGTFNERTVEDIQRVVVARAGVFRACYQKQLNHAPVTTGKVVVKFSIQPDGSVSIWPMDSATTMFLAEEVIQCLKRNIDHLKFQVTTSPSEVSYPFEFWRALPARPGTTPVPR